jgi:biopolymer transport protein ExbB/TolQ
MEPNKLVHRVKTYFIAALVLKAAFAYASLELKDPELLGFALPLLVMIGYWVMGYQVRSKWNTQLTLAKFADSVYYLGFLFTVFSIIVCLIDIKSIGDNLNGMAARFGAAMVSTAIGMAARVFHTGFRVDTNDAVKGVEERAIQSAESLAMSFDAASQQLEVFRDQVMAASKEAVQSVHEQITAISQHSTNAMEAFFANATRQSNDAFERILTQANDASTDLLTTINGLREKSEQTLDRMESHALDFGKKAQDRLDQTLFPDDLFSQKLNPAIDTLSGTTESLNEGVSTLALDVKTAARMVGTAIRSLNTKTESIGQAVTAVGSIVESQERLVESMKTQSQEVMERVERIQKDYLDSLDDQREDFMEDMKANQQVFAKVADKLEELRTTVKDNNTFERFTQEVTGALNAISVAGIKNNEALADNMRTTLTPLVDAVMASTDAHKTLAANVESSNRDLETAHSQLLDELMGKIDLISNADIRVPSVGEPTSGPSLESITEATLARENSSPADVRTA